MRVLLLGVCLVSLSGGAASAHEPARMQDGRAYHHDHGGYGDPRSGGAWERREAVGYRAPPWSGQYAYQSSASRMWSSSWVGESYREVGPREHGYGYAERDYRDCRCAPAPPVRPAEVYVRPGPVYMDRRPVYIEQRPVYIEQPPIYVSSPPIYVEGPPVYVESPPVYVDPPVVHVTPGPVHVAPPEVHVRPPEVVHEAPPPPPPPPPTHFGDLPPPGNVPPVAPPPHNYRQEPGERG
ncbi:hypothetical protein [Brevundimonas sp.]|uniref:hypothetical protein n=1 Tax=Brevundimonas sp. TaxID=1871086 RepID=UPI002FC75379